MKVKLLLVGKTVESYLRKGIEDYSSRLKHYVPFEIVEMADLKQTSALSRDQVKQREGEMILRQIKDQDMVILLDEHGKRYTSTLWARHLEQTMAHSSRDLVFVAGGCYGFSEQVYARSQEMVSLSDMTFSHQLVRLIFVEQLYRAFTIIKGEPYHHE